MLTTELPYAKTLSAIGEMSVEEIAHDRLVKQLDSYTPILDELYDSLESIDQLYAVRDSIMLKGVTPALVEDTKDYLWDTHEFDITAFENSGNEQLSYCLESLRTIIHNILLKIRDIINRVVEWFTTNSLTATWFNIMAYYKKNIGELYVKYDKIRADILEAEYSKILFSGYDRTTYVNLLTAYKAVADRLKKMSESKDYAKLQEEIDKYLEPELQRCGFTISSNGTVCSTELIQYRRDTVGAMEWGRERVLSIKDDLIKSVVDPGLELNKLKYQLIRNANNWTREIDRLLDQDIAKDDARVQNAQGIKVACVTLKRFTKFMMRYGSSLCAQWCRMVRMMDQAVITKTNPSFH